MRILYHHRTLLDGAEGVHITEMIRALERLGHQVDVVSPGDDSGRPGRIPRLVRRALPQGLFEWAAAGHNVVERHQALGILDRTRPDLLYKRHALNDVGMLMAARRAGVPSVLEVNTLYSSDALRAFEPIAFPRLARTLEAKALRAASLVVVVSSPLAQMVRELVPESRPMIVPNGANPDRFSPEVDGASVRRRFDLSPADMVVGWSGVMRAWHGLDLLLQALQRQADWHLLVVGDGPERANLEREAGRLGVQDRVRFTGRVPTDQMPSYLAAMDVGVVAADRTGYASPMKLLEYMAMAKPVVAPDLSNIRDIVAHGRHGLLFAPGDPAALAGCLDTLRDPSRRSELGQAARACVIAERNWTAIARTILDAVRGTADDEGPGQARAVHGTRQAS